MSIERWVEAGKACAVGSVDWSSFPAIVDQWRTDLNFSIQLSQVPKHLSTVAFYWSCSAGHTWRETAYKRLDAPAGKLPKWKRRAGSRSACRECVLEEFAFRYACGHRSDRLDKLGPGTLPGSCLTCQGLVKHRYACGWSETLRNDEVPDAARPCGACVAARDVLDADPALAERLAPAGDGGQPVLHEWVWWCCDIDGHNDYTQPVSGIVAGYGCPTCWKVTRTRGAQIPVGQAFRSDRTYPTSAAEQRLRALLAEQLPVADAEVANAVSIQGDFYGRGEVYPDILIPSLQVAVELDSPGRHQDFHTGSRADSDRLKDAKLAEAGWRVVRVRLRGLAAVDHATCIAGPGVSKHLAGEVVDAVRRTAHTRS